MKDLSHKLIVIKPMKPQPKKKVKLHGKEWLVHEQKMTFAASPKLGPWYFLQANKDGHFTWMHEDDFKLVDVKKDALTVTRLEVKKTKARKRKKQ